MSASPTRDSPPPASSSTSLPPLSSPRRADEVSAECPVMSPRSSANLGRPQLTPPPPPAPGGHLSVESRDSEDENRMSEDDDDEIDVTTTAEETEARGSNGGATSSGECSNSMDDEYFKPIKKLCMVQPRMRAPQPPSSGQVAAAAAAAAAAVQAATIKPLTSFFIKDILSHKNAVSSRRTCNNQGNVAVAAAAAGESRGIVRPWDCVSSSVERRRPLSADDDSRSEKSAESDSPESPPGNGGGNAGVGNSSASPLDALFEMTSKAFEGLEANEKSSDACRDHLNLFSNRQQPKKKRKSRTAFTNHQIFELEKRFLYQKYLSPADRDEIAQSLGLTNAQVITWFQNRRAKLKRDMEELKKDVDATTKTVPLQ